MTYDLALAALADPTRRAVYEEVRRRPRTVGELTRAARVSQPAVSQHLRVL
ncbi:MAG: ArsR/SmtB family transcription factor, partial [Gemmatimonadaceae bacterium]